MATKLKAVAPKATAPSKPKILIFGKPGAGKTWASLDFPTCYYIDTERGADLEEYQEKLRASGGAYFGPDQGSLEFSAIISEIQTLATEKHHYKTLVIDSISKIFLTEIAREAERLESAGKKNEYAADKKPAVAYMRRLVSWLVRLDMNVILIAHEKPLWGTNAKGEREEIGTTFDCWEKLEYELHLCLNIIKNGPSRIAKVKKTRLAAFPDATTFPWSYQEFASRYGQDIIEKEAEAIVLATPEQLAELNALISIFNPTEAQKDKWLAWGEAETFAEFETNKLAELIKGIKAKIPTPISTNGVSNAVSA